MRIVIVEDEKKPRDGIVRLLSKMNPSYEVVGEACNGAEGCEKVDELRPDLVITDVKMPIMDGLAMISELRSRGCKADFVILSGYAEFDYAKKGIVLGVSDYLLKPISPPMLKDLLERIGDRAEAGIPTIPPAPAEKMAGVFVLFYSPSGEMGIEALASRLVRRSCEKLRLASPSLSDRPDTSSYLFRVEYDGELGDFRSALEEELRREARAIARNGLVCSALRVTEGGALKEVAGLLQEELRWSILLGQFTVVCPESISSARFSEPVYPNALESRALDAFRGDDGERLEAAVEEFFRYCLSEDFLPTRIAEYAYRFLFAIGNLMKETDYVKFRSMLASNVLRRVEGVRSRAELELIVSDFLDCAARGTQAASNAYSLPVRQAINYVKTNLGGEISLAEAARKTGLTPEYLSALFFRETSRNFSSYVTELRIEAAKKILAKRRAKIYEAAEQVGFSDARYFCRVFKKATGLSPREYIKLHA
jgi:two-component system response regulator YesN